MGDVLHLPARGAGRTIIDRMAAAIAHEKGRNFWRMTRARQDQLRSQVRAALRALRPDDDPAEADIDLACTAWDGSAVQSSPARLIIDVRTYVDEVLR